MFRILILPSGNTFSHLRECELIGADLLQYGHLVHFGISQYYEKWAKQKGLEYTLIPELWERGPTDHPNVSWFIDYEFLTQCIQLEIELIDRYSPDYILADFKYTAGISARYCGVPLICKNILTMLPETKANFGYFPQDLSPASLQQRQNLDFFDRFATVALNQASLQFGLEPYTSMAEYLDGDWVLVPDSPWFHQITAMPVHYLPVNILQQSRCGPDLQTVHFWDSHRKRNLSYEQNSVLHKQQRASSNELTGRNIFLALGSVCRSQDVLVHLTAALGQGAWQLYVSMSGDNAPLQDQLVKINPKANIAPFWDFEQLTAVGLDLLVCQGGLGSIFNGIEHGVPMLIVPLQPEQDHNGLLVEAHGLGTRLGPSRLCSGKEDLYIRAILETPTEEIVDKVCRLLLDSRLEKNCVTAKKRLHAEMNNLSGCGRTVEDIFSFKMHSSAKTVQRLTCHD